MPSKSSANTLSQNIPVDQGSARASVQDLQCADWRDRALFRGEDRCVIAKYASMLSKGLWSCVVKLAQRLTLRCYSDFETSHEVFRKAMPNGFSWEVLKVYSG